jgi:hypothetical protein
VLQNVGRVRRVEQPESGTKDGVRMLKYRESSAIRSGPSARTHNG